MHHDSRGNRSKRAFGCRVGEARWPLEAHWASCHQEASWNTERELQANADRLLVLTSSLPTSSSFLNITWGQRLWHFICSGFSSCNYFTDRYTIDTKFDFINITKEMIVRRPSNFKPISTILKGKVYREHSVSRSFRTVLKILVPRLLILLSHYPLNFPDYF